MVNGFGVLPRQNANNQAQHGIALLETTFQRPTANQPFLHVKAAIVEV
jgi:hypothetical protein